MTLLGAKILMTSSFVHDPHSDISSIFFKRFSSKLLENLEEMLTQYDMKSVLSATNAL